MEQRSLVERSADCARAGRQCASGRRLILGLGVLMVVDVVWVASAVLSEVRPAPTDGRTYIYCHGFLPIPETVQR